MKTYRTIAGFTLIEMIVSLAVFTVVITIAVGALLSLIGSNEQLQNEQSVMTNLSFALDSMTREIRTGTHYYCASKGVGGGKNFFRDGLDQDAILKDAVGLNQTDNCRLGNKWRGTASGVLHGISFVEGGNSVSQTNERITYFFDARDGQIYRRVGTGAAQPIVSSGIFIETAEFHVTGAHPLREGALNNSGSVSTDSSQSSVTIYIEAREADDPDAKLYPIQTTVTQRTLDI